jgi:hypothetical protein
MRDKGGLSMRAMRYGIAIAAISGVLVTPAYAQLPTTIQVSQPGDANMTCPDLTAEIGRMDQVLGTAQQNQANAAQSSATAGAVGSAAVNGALYTGALGRVPGLGFLASGAQRLAQQNAEAKAAEAAKLQQDATMRRTMLMGMYTGKQCDNPQAQAQQAAAPAEAAPAAPPSEASFAPAGAVAP